MRRSLAVLLVFFACGSVSSAGADHLGPGFSHGMAGPIVTIPAATLPAGHCAAGVRVEWVGFDAFSDAELEGFAAGDNEVHSVDALLAPSLSLAFGVTDRLMLGARLPWISRTSIHEAHLEAGLPEVHVHGDSRGVGDLSVLGQYRCTGDAAAFQLALLAGVKAPTGASDVETEDGEPFETEHQPGSGSWDALLGAAWSRAGNVTSLDANVLYALVGEGEQETSLGNQLQVNLAAAVKLIGHSGAVDGGVDLVLEVNGEWHGRHEIAGEEEENSGGSLIYLAPGLRFLSGERWSLSASTGFPVVQNLNGTQHETELRVVAGLGVSF